MRHTCSIRVKLLTETPLLEISLVHAGYILVLFAVDACGSFLVGSFFRIR